MNAVAHRRILFITEGGLGDHVTLSPAIRACKESFPGCFIAVFATYRHPTDESKIDLFENLHPSKTELENSVFASDSNIDDLYVLNRYAFRSLPLFTRLRAEWSVLRYLRCKRFDTVISTFPHKDRFILWSLASGASNRVGAKNQGLRWLLTHTPDIEKADRGMVEYYCDLVRVLGATVRSTKTEYHVAADAFDLAEQQLRRIGVQSWQKYVAVHPGVSGLYKAWPPDRFAALIDHIQLRWDLPVVILKGAMDGKVVSTINEMLRSRMHEIDCSGNIGNLAALMQLSVLCITNDSGPRHLAVAVGAPSLAFFRQHHDREWDVYQNVPNCATLKGTEQCTTCPPMKCFDRVPAGELFGSYCLRMISTEEAISQVGEMLRAAGADMNTA